MTRWIGLVAIALALSGCAYDLDLGDLEGGVPADPDACAPAVVGADCTAGGSGCTFDQDCPGNLECNGTTDRCYSTTDVCEGTPCNFDGDCASGERCNQSLKMCVNMTRSQKCRPCVFDKDCGGTQCAPFSQECE